MRRPPAPDSTTPFRPRRSRAARAIERSLARPSYLVIELWKRVPLGSFRLRMDFDALPRPHYAYCLYEACLQARALGLDHISALEFGVAGGLGLLELERLAPLVTTETGVDIEIYGFDLAKGLPPSDDYRDLPYTWQSGLFSMDVRELERRLTMARLVLGDVAETVPGFLQDSNPAPIGFAAFDLDYYTSTCAALSIFEGHHDRILPRVYCYFDDTIGPDEVLHNEYVGELLAIKEFNDRHEDRKLTPINGLRHKRLIPAAWCDAIWALHTFEHPSYKTYIGDTEVTDSLQLNRRR